MKNITDYFNNKEKNSPNKEAQDNQIDNKSNKSKTNNVQEKYKRKYTKRKKGPVDKSNTSNTSLENITEEEIIEINSSRLSTCIVDNENSPCMNSNETSLDQNITVSSEKKNAFQIMMDNRHKSIGTNSPGKDVDQDEVLQVNDSSKILLARKKILSEWAELKGGAKRKREEEDRDEIIKIKLKKRSKRLKKLLSGNQDLNNSLNDFENVPNLSKKVRKKKIRRLSCSSNSSNDIEHFEKQKIESSIDKNCSKNEVPRKIKESTFIQEDTKLRNKKIIKEQKFNDEIDTENSKTFINRVNGDLIKNHSQGNKNIDTVSTDESSQESISTPSALRSWRMKIKLNLDENNAEGKEKEKFCETKANDDSNDSLVSLSSDSEEEKLAILSKPKKVAPVFLQATPKPKIDPEVLKARQEFLMSGTPSVLKLKHLKQNSFEEKPLDLFPSISHVQQKCDNPFWNLSQPDLSIKEYVPYKCNDLTCNNLINRNNILTILNLDNSKNINDITSVLNQIKSRNSDYPVYKVFRQINEKSGKKLFQEKQKDTPVAKKKRGRPKRNIAAANKTEEIKQDELDLVDYAMWTEKYKAKSFEDIIGNTEAIKKLKVWLETWKTFSQEIISKKKRKNSSSSEFETTDCDSRDSVKLPDNTIILGGPCGCGKSAAVYAICSQLGFNVIELNASSKRTGKKLLLEIQEATQSHQVKKGEKGMQDFFNLNNPKDKNDSQDKKTDRRMCVLLIEDIDIVFDQDDGFIIALQQLIGTSKRPIILTTNDYSSNYTQKFLLDYDCISFSPLQSNSLATWCQILCLVEGLYVNRDDIASLIDYNGGDIRRTILELQFWLQSGGQLIQEKMHVKIEHKEEMHDEKIIDDEQFEFSDGGKQNLNESVFIHKDCFRTFQIFERHQSFSIPYHLNLGFLWWNIPNIFGIKSYSSERINKLTFHEKVVQPSEKKPVQDGHLENLEKQRLGQLSNFYYSLSFADIMFKKYNYFDSLEPEVKNYTGKLKDSLELEEKFDCYEDLEFMHEITHTLVDGHIKMYSSHNKNEVKLDMGVPKRSEIRWRAKHHVCEDLFRESLSPWTYTERKSAALDYYPTLRTISRSEIQRAANNTKRGNRFRNYLRDLGIKSNENNTKIASKILWVTDN